jgi:hypothetical protein
LNQSKKQRGKRNKRNSAAASGIGPATSRAPALHESGVVRYTFITIGIISLILGIIGIVTPVLPTTPFILLSGYCFARGSERLHNWILSHRYFGPMIIAFREEKRIPLKVKIFATIMLVVTMSITAFFIVPLPAVKIGMGLAGIAVIAYIWTFRN